MCKEKQNLRKSKVNILKRITEKIAKLRAIYTRYIENSLQRSSFEKAVKRSGRTVKTIKRLISAKAQLIKLGGTTKRAIRPKNMDDWLF